MIILEKKNKIILGLTIITIILITIPVCIFTPQWVRQYEAQRLYNDTHAKVQGEIITKYKTSYIQTIYIPDNPPVYIFICNHYFIIDDILTGTQVTETVSNTDYGLYEIGDVIIVYLSERIELMT